MNPIVETTCGKLEGSEENDLFVFRGIPYAAAPNGALRWCAPVEPPAWKGVRPARAFGPACPQPSLEEQYGSVMAIGATDEDCLYLNVWSPALQDGGARPVMVYIHGGGFRIGAGSLAHYNGSALARRGDVVVVTINYRLGPFGFVHLDGPTQGAVPATGNEGLLDVVAALRWVQANVDAFGGDPANVTIFGQSAGGMSVAALLTMTVGRGALSQGDYAERAGRLDVRPRPGIRTRGGDDRGPRCRGDRQRSAPNRRHGLRSLRRGWVSSTCRTRIRPKGAHFLGRCSTAKCSPNRFSTRSRQGRLPAFLCSPARRATRCRCRYPRAHDHGRPPLGSRTPAAGRRRPRRAGSRPLRRRVVRGERAYQPERRRGSAR